MTNVCIKKPLKSFIQNAFTILVLMLVPLIVFAVLRWPYVKKAADLLTQEKPPAPRIQDKTGLITDYHLGKFDQYLRLIHRESDIDIRVILIKSLNGQTIEQAAIEKVTQLQIGGKTREQRGLLLLYTRDENQLRVEVGYGLEGYFPDVFVGYLMNHHTRDLVDAGNFAAGFHLMIRMLHYRIREEKLGNHFDPRVIEIIQDPGHFSGGGGATDKAQNDNNTLAEFTSQFSDDEKSYFTPQKSAEEAYFKFLEWLMTGKFDPYIELFTVDSQKYLARLPMTRAYYRYILIREYGRRYKIAIKDNLAMLYFAESPLLTPHFFVRSDEGWRMDFKAEVRNSRNRVGGVYVWDYRGRTDEYTQAFFDMFVNIDGYIRIKDGDNRKLPIRGDV